MLRLVAVMLLTVVTACGHQATPVQPPAETTGSSSTATQEFDAVTVTRLDAAIHDAMRSVSTPGAIIGVWGPPGRYVRAVGVADKATGAAMNPDFYTRIGSETKTFTVTAVLQLADQGKVGLDDPVAKYVDGVPQGERITLRQLARMQSGLYNYSDAFAQPAVTSPGQTFRYCNTNSILLGLVVENVSGQSLPDYIGEHILTPLGMRHTSFPTGNEFPQPHAQGYTNLTANGAEAIATDWDPSWGWAAAAMISTLEDLHIWAPAAATGKLLSPAMQRQRLETIDEPGLPIQVGYGLGIFNFAGWIGHSGTLPGYQTVAVYLPEQQLTLVILTNTDIHYRGADPATTLAAAITTVISPNHRYALSP